MLYRVLGERAASENAQPEGRGLGLMLAREGEVVSDVSHDVIDARPSGVAEIGTGRISLAEGDYARAMRQREGLGRERGTVAARAETGDIIPRKGGIFGSSSPSSAYCRRRRNRLRAIRRRCAAR